MGKPIKGGADTGTQPGQDPHKVQQTVVPSLAKPSMR